MEKEKKKVDMPNPTNYTLPGGHKIWLRGDEKICGCGEWVAQEVAGVCCRCEREGLESFYKEPKKKR